MLRIAVPNKGSLSEPAVEMLKEKGARLKDIGTRSRAAIEALLGTPVFLDLHVTVAKDWQRDPRQLRKLGF